MKKLNNILNVILIISIGTFISSVITDSPEKCLLKSEICLGIIIVSLILKGIYKNKKQ